MTSLPTERTRPAHGPVTRGMTKSWISRESSLGADCARVERPGLLARILAVRGLDATAAGTFLEPSLLQLHNPSLMPDMDKAAQRLIAAARGGERIVIYGDYDVDGISATAVLYHMLRHIAPCADVATYVPHRLDEGYGLNAEAMVSLAAEGAKVIVSVDCGVTAVGPALAARQAGVDLIITDHHNPPAAMSDLPEAFAVVHPRRPDSKYPFGDLSGSGVAFKLAWRLATMACGSDKVPASSRALLLELLGLTSLGVIADIVPLVGENRVMARFGLSRIRGSSNVGLNALVTASGLDGEKVQADDVGFRLGPRLNACGRLGHAKEAVELLTVADPARALEIATMLTRLNDDRRGIERAIAESAAEMAKSRGMTGDDKRAIVLADTAWHKGVVGIACSRLVGLFGRPTILMQTHDGEDGPECHGSARSIEGFNLHAALSECSHLLLGFGGHDMAAGVRVRAHRLDEFTQAFTAVANRMLSSEDLVLVLKYDTAATLEELTVGAVDGLLRLAPFGRDNPRPRVRLDDATLQDRVKLMGASGDHANFSVRAGGHLMRVVAFGWGAKLADARGGSRCDLVIEPKVSRWNGRESVEGELVDLAWRTQGPTVMPIA